MYSVVLTASSAVFASTDVGREIRLQFGAKWAWGEVVTYVSTTSVRVSLFEEIPLDSGTTDLLYNSGLADSWRFGAWSSTTGYPSTVVFHQNRLIWGSTSAEPTTQWTTKSGDYYTFEPSDPENSIVADDNALTVTLISRQVNRYRWMDSGPVLLIGTEGAEWQVKPSSIQAAITPTNVSATVQTSYGGAPMNALRVGPSVLFVDRATLKIRELTYDYSIDAYSAKDISIISEHIPRENGGIIDWAVQTSPYTILWLVLGNGKVASITYEKEHEVIAWGLHDFGGTVSSCCVTTSTSTTSPEDVVNFVVARTVNGASVKYVECITRILSGTGAAGEGAVYLNCHKVSAHAGAGVAGITTTHLVAATVDVVVDSVYIGQQVATAGAIHIGYLATVVAYGLPTTAIIGLLDLEGGSPAGNAQAKKKRIIESAARVENSWYFKIASSTIATNATENLTGSSDPTSTDYTRIVPILVLNTATAVGVPGTIVPYTGFAFVSGDVTFSPDDSFDTGARFQIVQDEPYPLNVNALMHKLNTNE